MHQLKDAEGPVALRDVSLVAPFRGAAKMLKRASAGRCRHHSGSPSRGCHM